MEYDCVLEPEEAVIPLGAMDFEGTPGVIRTPTSAHPVNKIQNKQEKIDPATRGIAEIYLEIDSGKLAEYNDANGDKRISEIGFVKRLRDKTEYYISEETLFTFFAYTDSREISDQDMRRYIELTEQFSEVTIAPIQIALVRALNGTLDNQDLPEDNELPSNVYRSFKNGVRRFCDWSKALERPIVGVLPLFDDYRQMKDIVDIYTEKQYDIDGICIDFRNCNITTEDYFDGFKTLMGNLRKMGVLENYFMYALNPRRLWISDEFDDAYVPGDFCLSAMGMDVIGNMHSPGGGSSQKGPHTIKYFEEQSAKYEKVQVNDFRSEFPESGIAPSQFESSESAATRLGSLLSSEQVEYALRDLRLAAEEGSEYEFFKSKEGITSEQISHVTKVADACAIDLSKFPS